jgi:hypothetical protein
LFFCFFGKDIFRIARIPLSHKGIKGITGYSFFCRRRPRTETDFFWPGDPGLKTLPGQACPAKTRQRWREKIISL